MNYNSQNNNSSFWMDQSSRFDVLTGEALVVGKDYHKIASTLRSISNFVNIVTGQNIPVEYNSKDQSYTDGKTVVISSNIKDNQYDATVGLALHEGSHVKLTDFDLLPKLMNVYNGHELIPNKIVKMVAKKYFGGDVHTADDNAKVYIVNKIKNLLNYVEDRRIDNFIYRTAPGYRGYYQAMYDKYFNSSNIDKGLMSGSMRELTWESYMFRLVNITNHHRDLNALPGLRKIWNILNLKNIDRLESTTDALEVAFEIFDVIEKNIPLAEEGKGGSNEDGEEGESDNEPIEGEDGSTTGGEPGENESTNNEEGPDAEEDAEAPQSQPTKPELDRRVMDKLKKDILKQEDFMTGDVKKTNMSNADKNKVRAVADSGSDMRLVGAGSGKQSSKGVQCVVVKNVTINLIESGVYSTVSKRWGGAGYRQKNIDNGIRLGKQLGRKLQIRNDETTLKYNRLRRGRMDKRMIASLGFGNEQVFQQIFTDRFKPVKLHLSIDASGSMNGEKWDSSQTSAVAIAQAASMCRNLDVVISYRSTEMIGNVDVPAIFIAYDSTKDKMTKIKKMFQYIGCPGITPEGLCFEAIQKEILSGSADDDSYFINFSDGAPYFSSPKYQYYGKEAHQHTKKQVDIMRSRGIKILSYFISGGSQYNAETDMASFKEMYGKDAEKVNVTQLNQLSKSLNKLFTEK
jgi:hypothetical protein